MRQNKKWHMVGFVTTTFCFKESISRIVRCHPRIKTNFLTRAWIEYFHCTGKQDMHKILYCIYQLVGIQNNSWKFCSNQVPFQCLHCAFPNLTARESHQWHQLYLLMTLLRMLRDSLINSRMEKTLMSMKNQRLRRRWGEDN